MRSKQSSRSIKSKSRFNQRDRSISIDPDHLKDEHGDESEEIQEASSSTDSPSLNVENLLKSLENQSKQNLIKRQNKTYQEIENLSKKWMDRLLELVESQESEFEDKVSAYFKSKAQMEDQRDQLVQEIIKQQESFKDLLIQLENSLEGRIEHFRAQSNLTIEQISEIDQQRKQQVYDHLSD